MECWTIHEAANYLKLSESRIRQKIADKSLEALKVPGKYGPEWRVRLNPFPPDLAPPVDAEELARRVLELEESIRELERQIQGRALVLVQAEQIAQLRRRTTNVATRMDACPIGQACLSARPLSLDLRSNCG